MLMEEFNPEKAPLIYPDGTINEQYGKESYGLDLEELSQVVSFREYSGSVAEMLNSPNCPIGGIVKEAYKKGGKEEVIDTMKNIQVLDENFNPKLKKPEIKNNTQEATKDIKDPKDKDQNEPIQDKPQKTTENRVEEPIFRETREIRLDPETNARNTLIEEIEKPIKKEVTNLDKSEVKNLPVLDKLEEKKISFLKEIDVNIPKLIVMSSINLDPEQSIIGQDKSENKINTSAPDNYLSEVSLDNQETSFFVNTAEIIEDNLKNSIEIVEPVCIEQAEKDPEFEGDNLIFEDIINSIEFNQGEDNLFPFDFDINLEDNSDINFLEDVLDETNMQKLEEIFISNIEMCQSLIENNILNDPKDLIKEIDQKLIENINTFLEHTFSDLDKEEYVLYLKPIKNILLDFTKQYYKLNEKDLLILNKLGTREYNLKNILFHQFLLQAKKSIREHIDFFKRMINELINTTGLIVAY